VCSSDLDYVHPGRELGNSNAADRDYLFRLECGEHSLSAMTSSSIVPSVENAPGPCGRCGSNSWSLGPSAWHCHGSVSKQIVDEDDIPITVTESCGMTRARQGAASSMASRILAETRRAEQLEAQRAKARQLKAQEVQQLGLLLHEAAQRVTTSEAPTRNCFYRDPVSGAVNCFQGWPLVCYDRGVAQELEPSLYLLVAQDGSWWTAESGDTDDLSVTPAPFQHPAEDFLMPDGPNRGQNSLASWENQVVASFAEWRLTW